MVMAEGSNSRVSMTVSEMLEYLTNDDVRARADEYSKDTLHGIIRQLYGELIPHEENLGNLDACRDYFNKWINTIPPLSAWLSYVYFELRHGQLDRVRLIFEALVKHLPQPSSWLHYAEFEFNYGSRVGVRICGQRAISNLKGHQHGFQELLLAFAKFEEQCMEVENAARLYKSLVDNNCIQHSKGLYKKIVDFEQRHGEKKEIVKRVLLDRRDYFESLVKMNPLNYEAWWDYIHMLEETEGDENCIRLLYRRALEKVPKSEEKSQWKKYVYLWIMYALFEEIDTGDSDRARQAYVDCIKLIPHDKFSFTKVWVYAAMFEVKQLQVENVREILDCAIRIIPDKVKIVRKYLDIELELGNVQQCRKLYTELVQRSADDCHEEWIKCAEYEKSIEETERARFIYKLAVSQPALQNSRLLWKAYADFEISVGEIEMTREVHKQMLCKKNHLNVCISLARFEAYGVVEILEKRGEVQVIDKRRCLEEARKVFDKALNRIPVREWGKKKEIVMEWLKVETSFGELGDCDMVYEKLPATTASASAWGERGQGFRFFSR